MSKSYSDIQYYSRIFLVAIIFLSGFFVAQGQIVDLPCQEEGAAFEGLERKNWNGGSTSNHSEGSMHNFTLPDNTFGDCKFISNVQIEISALGVDYDNYPADCPTPGAFYYNIASSCVDFSPASCDTDNLIGEPNTPTFVSQSLSYNSPPEDFIFGDNISVDIVPVMDINCSAGQSALTSDAILLDYEICVTVTISDGEIDEEIDLGMDLSSCPTGTTTIFGGTYTEYEWGPNGETAQTIDVGPGDYTITVTDVNGCTDTDEIAIFAFPDSDITFDPADPTVCDNDPISVSVVESYTSYNWSNALSGQMVNLTPGTYDVTITDSNNCTAVNTVTVNSIPTPNAGADNSETVCEGVIFDLSDLIEAGADGGGVFSDPAATGSLTGSMVNTAGLGGQTINFLYEVGLPGDLCGSDVATLTLIIEEPSNAGADNSEIVCEGIVVDLNDLIEAGADAGGSFSDPGSTGSLTGSMVNTAGLAGQTLDFIYEVGMSTDACGIDQATLTLIIESSPEAGSDNSIDVCEEEFVDLLDLLDVNSDAGGVFSDPASTGSLTGSIVNTLGLGGLTVDYIYQVGDAADPCGEDQATLTLIIAIPSEAGEDNVATVCDGEMFDLNDILGSDADLGGVFLDPSGSGSLAGSIVNTTGLAGQTIGFVYEVGFPSDVCGIDQAILTLIIESSVEAGEDNSTTVCEGTEFDLNDLLDANTSAGGIFSDPTSSGTLSGSIVNTTGLAGQTIGFIYEVGSSSDPCGSDEALLILTIETLLSAGEDNSEGLCLGGTVNLDDFLVNADLGGNYSDVDGSGGLNGNMLDTEDIVAGTYNYEYTVGDGVTCPFDTSNIEVLFSDQTEATFEVDSLDLCYDICQEVNLMISGEGPFTYDLEVSDHNGMFQTSTTLSSETNSFLINLCNDQSMVEFANDTLNFSNSDSLIISVQNIQGSLCDSELVDSLWITTLPKNEFLLDTSICILDTLFIDDVELFFGNSTYIDTLDGLECDSFININVTFSNIDTSYINETICIGDSINFFSTWFDEDNLYQEFPVSNEDGCDSLFIVDISLYPIADSLLNVTLCQGDFLAVNGNIYDSDNPTGQELLLNAATNGCDSLVNIDLQFGGGINVTRTDTLCEGNSILIGGTVIDETNNPIQLTVPGVDCDTIFDIDLTFAPTTTNNITGIFCSDFDTIVNGNIYDINNPGAVEVILGGNTLGCDSIIVVDLQFNNGVQVERTDTLCEGGSIVIGGTLIDQSNNPIQLIVPGVDCDTTFDITLTFVPPSTNNIVGTFCSDFDTLVNGTIYDISNPMDMEIIVGGNYLGCDSIILIDLQFDFGVQIERIDTLCEGGSIMIGGTVIDESNNPTQLIVPGLDCDTTFDINLTFLAPTTNNITGTFCSDFDTLVNGNLYDITNPSDTELILGGNSFGCDSIIVVDLSFTPCDIDVSVSSVDNNCAGGNLGAFNISINSPVDLPYSIILEESISGDLSTIDVDIELTNYQFENLVSGTYIISIIGNDGSSLYTSTEMISDLFPELNGDWNLIDTIFCNGDLAELEFIAIGGMPDYTYTWNDASLGNTSLISQITGGTYSVTVSDMNGCTFDNSIELIEPAAITATISESDVTCIGLNDGSIQVSDIQGGSGLYTILLDGVETSDPNIENLMPGNYTIEIVDDNTCSSMIQDVTIIESVDNQLVEYTLNYIMNKGDTITLVGDLFDDNLSFDWFTSSSLSCTDCANPLAFPTLTTTYNLLVINQAGCEQEVTITVEVIVNQNVIAIPNIFSPNGDGVNDNFIFGGEQISAIELLVFDRWGNQMHNSISLDGTIVWGGTSNGGELISGVYVYQLAIQYLDGTSEVRVSDITIVK